ncbi:glucokinase, partial [Escherichia coli]|uniref:glucokinase n=1 Tax=Escherichia coli TaxID=562 RepID=UPI00157C535D
KKKKKKKEKKKKKKARENTKRELACKWHRMERVCKIYVVILGRFGGDLALTLGTVGWVYIAGGIVPLFLEFFKASGFRAAFLDKWRFKEYVHVIPVYLIVPYNPCLFGSVSLFRPTFRPFFFIFLFFFFFFFFPFFFFFF